jgi:hypothetical protein
LGHRSVYPTVQMTYAQFQELFQNLPWDYIGADQMSDSDEGLPSYLDKALDAIRQLPVALQPLGKDPSATAALLSDTLGDPTRRRATLLLASLLDPVVTILSLDVIVGLAASDKDAVLVRQILGRVPHHEVVARVPPIVDYLTAQMTTTTGGTLSC